MKPFNIPKALDPLIDTYPPLETIVAAIKGGDRDTYAALARLWLSEGIPYCFKNRPIIYEGMRTWLSRQLQVNAKEITLIGSGRLGFSLSPDENLGRCFGECSDLDMTAISLALFERLGEMFRRWHADYLAGIVSPGFTRQGKYWEDNAMRVPSNLARGFIDSHKIPAFYRYPEAQVIASALYIAREKLKATTGAPRVRRVTLRVFRDWDSFIRQFSVNLQSLLGVNLRRP
jgi:hypothetical protein